MKYVNDKNLINAIMVQNTSEISKTISLEQIYIIALVVVFSSVGLYVLVTTLNRTINYKINSMECIQNIQNNGLDNNKKQIECEHNYCNKLKEHDYKYCITVLFLVLVFVCTLTLGNNSKVMEFISFAGTISSLILSVLAIIMTMLAESKNEGTKASIDASLQAIRDTADNLKENKKYINKLKTNLDVSLNNINNINEQVRQYEEKIEELANKLDGANKAIVSLNKTVNDIREIVPVIKQLANKQESGVLPIDKITSITKNQTETNSIDFSNLKKDEGDEDEK